MGRDAAENKSSALIYAPTPRAPPLTPAKQAEGAFERRLKDGLDTSDGGDRLVSFLEGEEGLLLPKKDDPDAEDFAQRSIEAMISRAPHDFDEPADEPLLQRHRLVAAFIARAGCRLSPATRARLAEVWITSDLRAGHARASMVGHLDFLIRNTSLERVSHKVVHRQVLIGRNDRKQASHHAHADYPRRRVACGQRMASLKMNWSNDRKGARPTCKRCLKLGAVDSPKVLRQEETTEDLFARRFERVAESARDRVGMSVMRPMRMAPRDFIDQARQDAWTGVVRLLAEACSEVGEPLGAATQSRLRRLWTPEGPEGWSPGKMPAVAL